MGRLTTHVLDTAAGTPGQGMSITLHKIVDNRRETLTTVVTNHDGRCDQPLLEGADFAVGVYELEFAAGDYFRAHGVTLPEPAFLDVVPLRFGIADVNAHYHVPLLVSPWSYSTYRGS
jgi:5-hydroxyisourate hydrolase